MRRRTIALLALAAMIAAAALLLARADGSRRHTAGVSEGRSERVAAASRSDSIVIARIAGGRFEASGVVHLAGTNRVLFLDDDVTRDVFVMELADNGTQRGAARRLPLGVDVTDLEGITTDGRFIYMVGSQSKETGFDGDGLVRFTLDSATQLPHGVERVVALKAWLAANVPELHGTARRIGDDVLNIEALAWDPGRSRLLLGLRAPVVEGNALVIPVALRDTAAALTSANLRVDGPALRLPVGGAGIRALEYDPASSTFLVITGASLNDETQDFRVLEWTGASDTALREIARFPRELKPEGITRAVLGGRSFRVLVFDAGYFALMP